MRFMQKIGILITVNAIYSRNFEILREIANNRGFSQFLMKNCSFLQFFLTLFACKPQFFLHFLSFSQFLAMFHNSNVC